MIQFMRQNQGDCMMDTMIKENGLTFKELEQNIFKSICEAGQKYTTQLLEAYDNSLWK